MAARSIQSFALAATLVATLSASAQDRRPPCFFMECGPTNAPNPAPAQPTILRPLPRQGLPEKTTSRPRAVGEKCASSSGFTYCASSILAPQAGNRYGPDNLFDGRLETAWVEGKAGDGIGEWVLIETAAPIDIAGVQLLNGYHKNQTVFSRNGRVRGLVLVLSNGYRVEAELEDRDGIQEIRLPRPQRASWVQLVLTSAYRGTKYADTAISELRVITAD